MIAIIKKIKFPVPSSQFPVTERGGTLMLAIVFTGIFVMVAGGLSGLALSQNKLSLKKIAAEQALQIAESGIDYYRWHLAHDPADFTDNTGQPGPYTHSVSGPGGSALGQFDLIVTPQKACTTVPIPPSTTIEGIDMLPVDCDCTLSLPPPSYHQMIKRTAGNLPQIVSNNLSISQTDNYTFELYAAGTFADNKWPEAEVIIDGSQTAAILTISSATVQTYNFTVSLAAGTHSLAIQYNNPAGNSGRTLLIYKTVISAETFQGTTVNESSKLTLRSTGSTLSNPDTTRTIEADYGKRTLADFAFLSNSNAWFADSETLNGPVHSNGGIRMEGNHNSTVSSAQTTYLCGVDDGCDPPVTHDGVWGSGGTPNLWQFPEPTVDFNQLTVDLADLKAFATSSGVYLPDSGLGYHLNFKSDGTFDLYQVDSLQPDVEGWDGSAWVAESNDILTETFIQNYTIPSNCRIIFVEDNVWVDGDVRGRVTLVSAVLPDVPATNSKVVINGDIIYTAKDGTDSLGIIAQKDILIPLYSPDDLEINAAMLAQKGHIMRYYYLNSYAPYHLRNSIEVYGSIITNTAWTFSWVDTGTVVSGYQNTLTTFDPFLTFNPPPGFPTTGEYVLLKWEEITP